MQKTKKYDTRKITIIGAVIVAGLLILGTIYMGKGASTDTESAVRLVSRLYLDELAGRREQVVDSRLNEYIQNMDVAIGLIDEKDLKSKKTLSAYQLRMKQLYDLEKFAFVDDKGLIYTSRGTRTDLDRYAFDYKNISYPEISVADLDTSHKKCIIAMPVDNLPIEGRRLVVCFMEIDMETMLSGISLQSDNNNTTFCNIYTKDGVALTNMVLGGLASEDNLLDAIEKANFEEGSSAEKMRKDFSDGRPDVISFQYNDISETMSYVPIDNTDWMLTYLIRENVISDQISFVSTSIIRRNLVMSVSVTLVMLILFALILSANKRTARATIEKEVSEAEIRVKQQELEEQIALQEELAEAVKNANRANEAKTSFLSNMSHEIRTPITAVLGMNEMIRRESDDENILAYSDNIRQAGASLQGIISDILDFSKIESGHMELTNAPFSLPEFIGNLYNLVRFRAEEKGLALSLEIDPSLPSGMIGDELRLKQVITNLLTNAIKYTEKGSVTFIMRNDGEKDGAADIFVAVKDTGIGIRPEDMDKLFSAFDRLDLQRNRTIEGTGLGLAITRRLIGLMGSELNVDSTYEIGSTFYFTLRQAVSDEKRIGTFTPEQILSEHKPHSKRISPFTAPDARILLVDDTPMNLKVVAGLLKRTLIKIDTASGGEECIELFGKNDYDMVFLDYRMPGIDGIETLKKLELLYPVKFQATPVISLTASAVSGDRERMISAGFTDYLAKPVNIDEMEHMMMQYLPQNVVILTGETPDEAEEDEDELPAAIWDIPGLDPEKGLDYCGDAEDYLFALETYEASIDEKAARLEQDLAADDIESFTLNIHSLKSTSAAIGADALSRKAEALELAGKEEDRETLSKDLPALLQEYRAMKDSLQKVLITSP